MTRNRKRLNNGFVFVLFIFITKGAGKLVNIRYNYEVDLSRALTMVYWLSDLSKSYLIQKSNSESYNNTSSHFRVQILWVF